MLYGDAYRYIIGAQDEALWVVPAGDNLLCFYWMYIFEPCNGTLPHLY